MRIKNQQKRGDRSGFPKVSKIFQEFEEMRNVDADVKLILLFPTDPAAATIGSFMPNRKGSPMADRFSDSSSSIIGPAAHAFPITPSDSAVLAETTRGIYCGAGGDIVATMLSGAVVTLANVAAGTLLPLRATKVAATGTTANGLVGLV